MYEVQEELLGRAIELCRDVKPKIPTTQAGMLSVVIKVLKEIRADLTLIEDNKS